MKNIIVKKIKDIQYGVVLKKEQRKKGLDFNIELEDIPEIPKILPRIRNRNKK